MYVCGIGIILNGQGSLLLGFNETVFIITLCDTQNIDLNELAYHVYINAICSKRFTDLLKLRVSYLKNNHLSL